VALQGPSDNSVDILSASLNLQLSTPAASLETYKREEAILCRTVAGVANSIARDLLA
jgi:hypothetical protein